MRKQRQKGREDDYATVEHPNPLRIAGILADLLTRIQGYRRFKDGDNRALPIRGDKR